MVAASACGRRETPAPPPAAAATTPPAAGVPHGDHNPHHGGIVMMKGDVHYELVMDPAGHSHRLYFTDAVREDLPASIASNVVLTIRRPHAAEEVVPMRIDDAGENWQASGKPVDDPKATMVHVAFTIGGEPYAIDLPFTLPSPPS
jgi:hypothetical protein